MSNIDPSNPAFNRHDHNSKKGRTDTLRTIATIMIPSLAISYALHVVNENDQKEAFATKEVTGQHTVEADQGILLSMGARLRANPVTGPSNIACVVPQSAEPIVIGTHQVTLVRGVATNPYDPNGPWALVSAEQMPEPLKAACAAGLEYDEDDDLWVSLEGGRAKIN